MAKGKQKRSPADTRPPLSPLVAVLLLVGIVTAIILSSPQTPIKSGLPGTIPLEVHDPASLEQNGQPLTNDQSVTNAQDIREAKPVNQPPPSSNLQGSPSLQQPASADQIPADWLE